MEDIGDLVSFEDLRYLHGYHSIKSSQLDYHISISYPMLPPCGNMYLIHIYIEKLLAPLHVLV